MSTPDEQFLGALEVEVDAGLAMIESGRPDPAAAPAQWTDDPAEIEYEEASLRSLRGAIEALEEHHGPEGGPGLRAD
ncbi:hypothetical protein [Kribbella sp. CA-293567]|uniref:hypothetical protein n=1 Tax=Kribbella sp. CA-293567 TaxID=3002436 RepID=UPI0022DCE961|nr:hypothetical protein [Kribbella sp. CA-293567]WBQ08147.1 hypothetical protein OX958_15395 [Kribbella sp. CA-293567]